MLVAGREFDIYSSPAVMESPSPVVYLDEKYVEDDPNAPLLSWTYVDQRPETGFNFRVNEAAVFGVVRDILLRHAPPCSGDTKIAN